MSLTRSEFEEGIQPWLKLGRGGRAATATWTVKEQPYTSHRYLQSLGRPVLLEDDTQGPVDDIETLPDEETDDDDAAAAATPATSSHRTIGTVDLYVVWSPVYQVPALLFRGYNSGGSPLALDRLTRSSLFRTRPDEYPISTLHETGHDEDDSQTHLPAFTQVEHPDVPGLMCYSLHPCETTATLAEILLSSETASDSTDSPYTPLRILQAWFMLVGTVIALR